MNRHPFRWQGTAFGMLFWVVAGTWAVWQHDLLTTQEFSRALSVVLIVAGLIGVLLTFWRPGHRSTPASEPPATEHPAAERPATERPATERPATDTPTTPQEELDGSAAHPQQ